MIARSEPWTVEKKIPLALIGSILGAIFLQCAVGIWYFSKMDSRVANLEALVPVRTLQIDKITADRDEARTRLTRVEDQIESMLSILRRMENRWSLSTPGAPVGATPGG